MFRQTPTALALILLGAAATPIQAADATPESKRTSVGEIWSVAYSPNGRTLATGSGNRTEGGKLILWDVLTGKPRFILPQPREVRSLAFSPDGEKVAAGGWDNTVRIYETRTGQIAGDAQRTHRNGQQRGILARRQDVGLGQRRQDRHPLGHSQGRRSASAHRP